MTFNEGNSPSPYCKNTYISIEGLVWMVLYLIKLNCGDFTEAIMYNKGLHYLLAPNVYDASALEKLVYRLLHF